MSCSVDVRCSRCRDYAGLEGNHNYEQCVSVAQNIEVLSGAYEALNVSRWFSDGGDFKRAVRFAWKHKEHPQCICVVTEYSETYGHNGECNEQTPAQGFCPLPKGHSGEHIAGPIF